MQIREYSRTLFYPFYRSKQFLMVVMYRLRYLSLGKNSFYCREYVYSYYGERKEHFCLSNGIYAKTVKHTRAALMKGGGGEGQVSGTQVRAYALTYITCSLAYRADNGREVSFSFPLSSPPSSSSSSATDPVTHGGALPSFRRGAQINPSRPLRREGKNYARVPLSRRLIIDDDGDTSDCFADRCFATLRNRAH